jgi:hypothetical protein
MKYLTLLFLSLVVACNGTLIKDPSPPTIDSHFARVETKIWDVEKVGENGCVYSEGVLEGNLSIYKVLQGTISIIGAGCEVDYSTQYAYQEGKESPWLEIPLTELIPSGKLENDCVLTIYQYLRYDGYESTPFPIQGIYGSVILGTSPHGVSGTFNSEQIRSGWLIPFLTFQSDSGGQYLLRGCGKELIPPTRFDKDLSVDLGSVWPGGYSNVTQGACTFILSVKENSGKLTKHYQRINIFNANVVKLSEPALQLSLDSHDEIRKISFIGDPFASLTLVDDYALNASQGHYEPGRDGDTLRFYTTSGRTLKVLIKNGKVLWAQ